MRDDAVSSTIAVILLVAIAVVLATGVYFLLADTGSRSGVPPASTFTVSEGSAPTLGLDASVWIVQHRGGPCIGLDHTRIAFDRGAGLVDLQATAVDQNFCVGDTMALDEVDALDVTPSDSTNRVRLVMIDQVTQLILFEELVQVP